MTSADDVGPQEIGGDAGSVSAAAMHERDRLAAALGIELVRVSPGEATVRLIVDERHLNGLGGCHGGAMFVLADTALAAACNSHGVDAVAATATIEFVAPVSLGSVLTATAVEAYRRGRTGFYDIDVTVDGETVALFRGRTRVVGSY